MTDLSQGYKQDSKEEKKPVVLNESDRHSLSRKHKMANSVLVNGDKPLCQRVSSKKPNSSHISPLAH